MEHLLAIAWVIMWIITWIFVSLTLRIHNERLRRLERDYIQRMEEKDGVIPFRRIK